MSAAFREIGHFGKSKSFCKFSCLSRVTAQDLPQQEFGATQSQTQYPTAINLQLTSSRSPKVIPGCFQMGGKLNLRILKVAWGPETLFWVTRSEPLFLLRHELLQQNSGGSWSGSAVGVATL